MRRNASRRRPPARTRAASDSTAAHPSLTLRSLGCGIAVVAAATVPSLFNPRGHDAFTVVKTGLIEGLGPAAALCAALLRRSDRKPVLSDPLVLAGAAVAGALVLSTVFGLAPAYSFFGPGVRHEGTFVALSLIAIAAAVAALEGARLDLVVTAIVAGSVGPSLYVLIQTVMQSIDAAAPGGIPRLGGTFGNPILLGGYLATVIPLTAARALGPLMLRRDGTETPSYRTSIGYGAALAVQAAALFVVNAKGAWIATAVGAAVMGACRTGSASRRRAFAWLGAASVVLTVSAAALVYRADSTVAGRTVQVRMLIWRDAARLIAAHPSRLLFGYGPEMLGSVIGAFQSHDLVLLEGNFAVTDRAHNDLLDTLVASGVCGAAAVIALHLLLWARLYSLVSPSAARWTMKQWTALGLLGAAVAHFVEIQFGVANVSSRLIWWCIVGIAVASRNEGEAAPVADEAFAPTRMAAVLAAAGAIAALTFSCWSEQPGVLFDAGGLVCIVATAAVLASLVSGGSPGVSRVAATLAVMVASAGVMGMALALVGSRGDLTTGLTDAVTIGERLSHQATLAYLMFGITAGAVGYYAASRSRADAASRRLTAPVLATALLGIAALVAGARTVRADMLARVADSMQDAKRAGDAEALQRRRVELTPESDAAWSALGKAELALARGSGADRSERFSKATAALAEAQRRNPQDWLHYRNQASAERQWAAAEPASRAPHLSAADGFYRRASELAPASAILWAEWGNADAERGMIKEAFAKLERAAALGNEIEAKAVADALLRATGLDLGDRSAVARAASQLAGEGHPSLAALYSLDNR